MQSIYKQYVSHVSHLATYWQPTRTSTRMRQTRPEKNSTTTDSLGNKDWNKWLQWTLSLRWQSAEWQWWSRIQTCSGIYCSTLREWCNTCPGTGQWMMPARPQHIWRLAQNTTADQVCSEELGSVWQVAQTHLSVRAFSGCNERPHRPAEQRCQTRETAAL